LLSFAPFATAFTKSDLFNFSSCCQNKRHCILAQCAQKVQAVERACFSTISNLKSDI
jgi:hypothetical protein